MVRSSFITMVKVRVRGKVTARERVWDRACDKVRLEIGLGLKLGLGLGIG